ncbi:hypothetical protein NQ318_019107 [Aromia moschata]|uniref:Uncharacterized protein n=1 Tax=Aromia moschata TaxID=1265417 RepID=A0AAV8XT96_9CUCU|nr:hypothetical protein NQ318_019107 [Aromia moschata]
MKNVSLLETLTVHIPRPPRVIQERLTAHCHVGMPLYPLLGYMGIFQSSSGSPIEKARRLGNVSKVLTTCRDNLQLKGAKMDNNSADDWLWRQNTNAGRSCSHISRKYPELPPISQGTFRERGHVRQLKKNPTNKLSDDQKLDVMLMLEPFLDSPRIDINQIHPYKLVPTKVLAEDDFDR